MSTYQHQCVLDNFLRDSLPDYLTCGYCAQEFVLDNITKFIAHKMGGCDNNMTVRTSRPHQYDHTPAAMTCSSCPRIFMTARGMLHHIQKDHQMVLCLQKDPLFVSDNVVQPPPAHSTVNMVGFKSTQDKPSCRLPHVMRTGTMCDHSELPTDLSVTCPKNMDNTQFKCSKDKCEITLEPINSYVSTHSTRPGTVRPKKRKFVVPQQNDIALRITENIASRGNNGGSNHNNDDADNSCADSKASEQTDYKSNTNTTLSKYVAAKYQKETFCRTLLTSEKKDSEKHSKLKRLLQQNTLTSQFDELSVQTCHDDAATAVVYKVAFLSQQDLESVTLKASTDEAAKPTLDFGSSVIGNSDSVIQTESLNLQGHRSVSKTKLEQNINHEIKSAVTSDIYPKELETLHSISSFSLLHGNEPKLSSIPVPCSPCLFMSCETNGHISHNSFNLNVPDMGQQNNITSYTSQQQKLRLVEVPERQSKFETSHPLSTSNLSSKISPEDASVEFLKNSRSLAKSEVPHSNALSSSPSSMSNGVVLLADADLSMNVQSSKHQVSEGEHFLKVLNQSNASHTVAVLPRESVPFLSVLEDPTYRRIFSQSWLDIQNENSLSTGLECISKPRSISENLDTPVQDSLNQDYMETDNGLDMKTFKKRRYPTSRPFKCTSCDQAFNQRIHLKKHMSKHTGVKPFKCQQCDYSTVERSHLKVHYRIHTGEKPYRCIYCDYSTAQNSTLKIHLKRHHERHPTSEYNRLKDNSHSACALDDDECILQENFCANMSSNIESLVKDKIRSSSTFDGRDTQVLSVVDASQNEGEKLGDSCSSCSNTSSCTPPSPEHFQSSPSLEHVSVENAICSSDTPYIRNDSWKSHKVTDVKHDLHDNSVKKIIKNVKDVDKTCDTIEGTSCHHGDRLASQTMQGTLLRDNVQLNIYTDTISSPVQFNLAHGGDNLSNKSKEISNSLTSKTSKSMTKSELSHSIESSETTKQKLTLGSHSLIYKLISPQLSQQISSVRIGSETSANNNNRTDNNNENPEISLVSHSQLVKAGAREGVMSTGIILSEDSDLESCDIDNSHVLASVWIPDKAFVRG